MEFHCSSPTIFKRLQKGDSSVDAVMLGRTFISDERNELREDRRLAAEDPGKTSF